MAVGEERIAWACPPQQVGVWIDDGTREVGQPCKWVVVPVRPRQDSLPLAPDLGIQTHAG